MVDLKRDADPNVVINQLYQYTPCQITVSMINIALVNRQPRTMGLKELIQHFIEHRKEVITRRTQFLLQKAQQREHILEGLIFAVCDIDEVVRLIRSSKTREEAIAEAAAAGVSDRDRPATDRIAEIVPKKYQSFADGLYAGVPAQEKPLLLTPGSGGVDRPAAAHPIGGAGDREAGGRVLKTVAEEIEGYRAHPGRRGRADGHHPRRYL